jgi:probable addiction module antidote protein
MSAAFTPWNSADYLKTDEDIAAYFDACLEDDPGDGSLIRLGLQNIARAQGLSHLNEEQLNALSASENVSFAAVLKVLSTLGLRLHTEVLHS